MVEFPAREVGTADLPVLALPIRCQNKRALLRANQHSYLAHVSLPSPGGAIRPAMLQRGIFTHSSAMLQPEFGGRATASAEGRQAASGWGPGYHLSLVDAPAVTDKRQSGMRVSP